MQNIKKCQELQSMVTKGHVAIPEKYDKPITSLKTTYAEELKIGIKGV